MINSISFFVDKKCYVIIRKKYRIISRNYVFYRTKKVSIIVHTFNCCLNNLEHNKPIICVVGWDLLSFLENLHM